MTRSHMDVHNTQNVVLLNLEELDFVLDPHFHLLGKFSAFSLTILTEQRCDLE